MHPVLHVTGDWVAFPRVLGRDATQDRRAQRGRIRRGVGCEVRAGVVSPLQHRLVVDSLVPR
eukprot:13784004-Alexandrium_andersonii.AAC.1